MKKFTYYHLSNDMLAVNLLANFVGHLAMKTLSQTIVPGDSFGFVSSLHSIGAWLTWASFLFVAIAMLRYELPIRQCLKDLHKQREVSETKMLQAQKRLLNEPFFVVIIDLVVWCATATLFALIVLMKGGGGQVLSGIALQALVTGLITVTLAFFWIEHIIQHRLAPVLFPEGGLHRTPGVLRIKISTRILALIFAAVIVPLSAIHLTIHGSVLALADGRLAPSDILGKLQRVVAVETLIFMALAAGLAMLVATNLSRPLREIVDVLQEVSRGLFDRKVRVASNDEIGYTADIINGMTEGLKERDFIKETFGKYVSKEVRDEILQGRIPLDGEMKEVTVLFADLRNFTSLVEATPPREVVRIINGYFEEMAAAIKAHQGLVLQFIGDEIEAVFGAPLTLSDHQTLAARAALEMRWRITLFNIEQEKRGWEPIRHSIGIHTGKVVAANIGSPDRLSYALVGDTVNLASRIQGLNKEFGTDILLSGATSAGLDDDLNVEKLSDTRVRGKSEPVEIYKLI